MDDVDRENLLAGLAHAVAKEGCILYAFCFMDNHLHLLMETTNIPLNRIMRGLLTKFSHTFNGRHARVGHLFQGRYQALICDKESYRKELLRYIHLNPVRAGLVDAPEDWRWSSHRAYLGRTDFPMVTMAPILEEFGNTLARSRVAFAQFVQDGMKAPVPVELLEDESHMNGVVLGSGLFHKNVRKTVAKPRRRRIDLPTKRRRVEDIIQSIAKQMKIDPSEVCGKSRRLDVARARVDILYGAVEAGWSQAEVARALKRTESWASQTRRRHPDSALED